MEKLKAKLKLGIKKCKIRLGQTYLGKTFEETKKYEKVFQTLVENDFSVSAAKERRSKIRQTQMIKGAIMLSGIGFLFLKIKIGIFNKILISLIGIDACSYMNTGKFYKYMINDLISELTFVGEETRILFRYYLPNHPFYNDVVQYSKLYRTTSKERDTLFKKKAQSLRESIQREALLDEEFQNKLKDFDKENSEF
jgi:hypothetical protein